LARIAVPAAWPFLARAQQPARLPTIGFYDADAIGDNKPFADDIERIGPCPLHQRRRARDIVTSCDPELGDFETKLASRALGRHLLWAPFFFIGVGNNLPGSCVKHLTDIGPFFEV
jgi:hypothetical protein